MIVVIGSGKASPGVSTLAAGLAAAAGQGAVLVEADPDGGSVAPNWQLSVEVGMQQVAAQTGRGVSVEAVTQAFQPLAGGPAQVLVAPTDPGMARSVFGLAARPLAPVVGRLGDPVVIDVGRAGRSSLVWPLVEAADLAVVTCRPRLPEVAAVAHSCEEFAAAVGQVGIVCVGDSPYPTAEVAEFGGVRLFGVVADDSAGAAAFSSTGSPKVLRWSPWWRSVRTLATDLFSTREVAVDG